MDLTAQIEREQLMADEGSRRVLNSITKAKSRGMATDTPGGVEIVKRAVAPLATAIREFVGSANAGRAGRRNTAAAALEGIDPDLIAYLTVKTAIDSASRHLTLRAAAIAIAYRLEMEVLADKFETANSALYRAIVRNAKERGLSPERYAKSVQLAADKFGVASFMWDIKTRAHIGTKLIELFIAADGPVESQLERRGKNQTNIFLTLTDKAENWIERHNEVTSLARPMFLPAVVPPKPWDDVTGGSYYSPAIQERSILSRSFPGQIELLREANLTTVYAGLNGLQETPWRINRRVFDVMQEAYDKALPLPCVPSPEDMPLPAKPEGFEEEDKGGPIRAAWRKEAATVHRVNNERRSRRFEFIRGLGIAKDNLDQDAIYFPHRCDFRGRAYAAATTLNPQGPDEIKALLHFAEGKPLGERGLFWLGVHGANLFGNDKVSLEERWKWANLNMHKAKLVAQDPLSNQWWTEADKPWAFLAWCFEWRGTYFEGEEYVSHLPIALDGSCNGIQHYSAMLRDEVGGLAVNLIPSETPNDIYQTVCDTVKIRLEEIVMGDEEVEDYDKAWGWHHFPLDRKVTKRPVMVLPYGGMFKSCMDYVSEAVEDKVKAGAENPFGDDLSAASRWLAKHVWDSIGDTVIAARAAMSWLQKMARIMTAHGQPLTWTTPSGFVVCQHYRETKADRIKTRFFGSIIQYRSPEHSDKIDLNRQASSVAPNFVHSMDASAMMKTIERCAEEGIRSFAMIHDSYGTHAADTDKLASILRECFVEMYLNNDVLAQFEERCRAVLPTDVEIPPRPAMGSLDISAVKESAYFFA